MKNYTLSLLLLIFTYSADSSPLHSKLKHNIIIDTDCNDSDLSAIGILLSHPGITIKAILVSGTRDNSTEGIKKIKNLLKQFKADTIPVEGERGAAGSEILSATLSTSKEELTLVCLGSMAYVTGELQKNQALYKKIEEVIWFNDSAVPPEGSDYDSYPEAVKNLLNNGIHIDIISNLNFSEPLFNSDMIQLSKRSETSLAKAIYKIAGKGSARENRVRNSELAAIYLVNPELFEVVPIKGRSTGNYNLKISVPAIKEVLKDMITGRYKSGNFVAFYGFPVNPEIYTYDIRMIMDSAITRYGTEEWKACVMTDEFHGHLGVFSIVGAKMGILARDYFGVSTDLLKIETSAGLVPPFSCMNDGLQVSTGATLGQGTIHLSADTLAKPQAVFTYQGKSILIKLKTEYLQKLKEVIDEGIENYGLEDDGYWTLVRQTSIKYWLEWDRKEIFELKLL